MSPHGAVLGSRYQLVPLSAVGLVTARGDRGSLHYQGSSGGHHWAVLGSGDVSPLPFMVGPATDDKEGCRTVCCESPPTLMGRRGSVILDRFMRLVHMGSLSYGEEHLLYGTGSGLVWTGAVAELCPQQLHRRPQRQHVPSPNRDRDTWPLLFSLQAAQQSPSPRGSPAPATVLFVSGLRARGQVIPSAESCMRLFLGLVTTWLTS